MFLVFQHICSGFKHNSNFLSHYFLDVIFELE